MKRNSLFLIMEVDLENRFTFFEKESSLPVHKLNLKNKLLLSKFQTIRSRLKYKTQLEQEYQKLKVKLYSIEKLFISNPEGFIAKNIIFYIKKDFPDLEIVSLQHGIFSLKKDSYIKKNIKKFINALLKPLIGYFVIGDGFGDKTTDKYIVYNSLYKSFLIENGWNDNDVVISSYFLKGEKHESIEKNSVGKKAVFFLQCMSKLGITDLEFEQKMISRMCRMLELEFDEILIKQHPYAQITLPTLSDKCKVVDTVPDISEIGIVVSAFSTALLEYEKFKIPCVAIKSNKLKVDIAVYDQFIYYVDYDHDTKSDKLIYHKNNLRNNLPIFFEPGITKLEKL